jgi:glycosyltransferase involved in cell wall biosynthesis
MKIYFIGPLTSTFVKNDIRILESEHKLTLETSGIGRKWSAARFLFKQFFSSIVKVLHNDLIYCWFADYASFFPAFWAKIFGKKVIVVAGGFDVGYIPELKYGARAKPLRWLMVKFILKNASLILPVSEYAQKCLDERLGNLAAPSQVVYNCVDIRKLDEFRSNNTCERNYVMTVSQADTMSEFIIKGIDIFISTAALLPEYSFVLAGVRHIALDEARKRAAGMTNFEIIPGPLDLYKDLSTLYSNAACYLQLSRDETFGVAVVEAMRFGAMPVVANIGALPEIAGSDDFIVNNQNETVDIIRKSFTLTNEQRKKIAEYPERFAFEIRREKIITIIKQMIED